MSGSANARKLCAALLLGVLSATAVAHSILEFDDWMQRIDDGSQDLQRQIADRKRDAAADSAREIEQLYGQMEEYFEKRAGADDAVRIAREGKLLASLVQKDLAGQRFGAAKAKAIEIAHGCRGCRSCLANFNNHLFHFKSVNKEERFTVQCDKPRNGAY